jgi:hypothetical protein
MESQDLSSVERMLFDSMRSYLRVRESGTDDEQAAGLRDICSTMARLLGRLLEADERWNRFWWVDDVLLTSARPPMLTKNPAGYELKLQGLMIWGQRGTSKEWVEPCSIALSEAAGALKYQIHCGDAHQGLGKVPYGRQNKKTAQSHPEQWRFVFSKWPRTIKDER